MTIGRMKKPPFSLSCSDCDAGIGVNSFADAMRAGWSEITYDGDGLAWNYLGLCPECKAFNDGIASERSERTQEN